MNPAEKIQAAIDKLDALRIASGTEAWTWESGEDLGANVRSEQFGVRFTTGYVGNNDSRNDAELIVTLHRTIDAQLAILRAAKHAHKVRELGNMSYSRPDGTWRTELEVAALDLADAMLGDSDA